MKKRKNKNLKPKRHPMLTERGSFQRKYVLHFLRQPPNPGQVDTDPKRLVSSPLSLSTYELGLDMQSRDYIA
ncbi:hypothetical protein M419DRAFT_124235 [Trichoderma reesei RUT C-30]|uniref:Uncharacterized protein n=1 Tax=Hypocrea jecorina (strain ATCC 56765 / BCRC 32924 / NRRL 11460 / Rut C-30) TaxID=1344414 RepID=A0A024S681_HYPJR|nr:hypothetical protein M419DRAFT_124235 [Trichoderma reesei RUT C-30]